MGLSLYLFIPGKLKTCKGCKVDVCKYFELFPIKPYTSVPLTCLNCSGVQCTVQCIVVCCLYVHKSYFIQEFIVYMRCIFPCLQLIYFYMGVEYIMLFISFALGSQDWSWCCTAYALLTDRDRQSTDKDRRIQSTTGHGSLSEREGSSCFKKKKKVKWLFVQVFCYFTILLVY